MISASCLMLDIRFSDIFWIDASSEATIDSKLKQIAKANNVSTEPTLDWISTRSNWLMVFDNADGGYEIVDKFLPPGNGGNILITSRNKDLVRITLQKNSAEVHGMDEKEAVSLLLKSATIEDEPEMIVTHARKIVSELGYIPLAIDQAGAYMQACNCGPEDYLDLYHNECRDLMMSSLFKGASNYGKCTYGTWEISMKEIESRAAKNSDPGCCAAQSAVIIHKYFAFLHHDGISEDIFKSAAENYSKRDIESEKSLGLPLVIDFLDSKTLFLNKASQWSRLQFQAGIKVLLSFSLIKSSNKVYSIHPLVHAWSRDRISSGADVSATYHKAAALLSCSIQPFDDVDNYVLCMQIIPQIKACYAHAMNLQIEETYFDDECESFAFSFDQTGNWREAEQIYTNMMEKRVAKLGIDHPDSLHTIHCLTVTYWRQQKWYEAEKLALQVLEGRKLGTDDPDTLTMMGNLALIYSDQGNWEEAEKLLLQVLDAYKAKFGTNHPYTLQTMHNLAEMYHCHGMSVEAEKLCLQALDGRKAKLGTDHLNTLDTMYILAKIYTAQGSWEEGEKLYLQVLDGSGAKLGSDHPDILNTMCALANIYIDQSRWEEAERLLLQVLNGWKKRLGANHPDTLDTMHNLAYTYAAQGRWEEAEELALQVLDGRKAKLGTDHPNTLSTMCMLAFIHEKPDNMEEAAARVYERSW
jgi:tetratricopeptide (TPR) repeat protein